jgi:hypothetical protein
MLTKHNIRTRMNNQKVNAHKDTCQYVHRCGNWPNTYTLTKHMGEVLLAQVTYIHTYIHGQYIYMWAARFVCTNIVNHTHTHTHTHMHAFYMHSYIHARSKNLCEVLLAQVEYIYIQNCTAFWCSHTQIFTHTYTDTYMHCLTTCGILAKIVRPSTVTWTHTHTRTHTHTQSHRLVYIHTYIHTPTPTPRDTDTHTHTHTQSHRLVYIHTYIHTYTHTHRFTDLWEPPRYNRAAVDCDMRGSATFDRMDRYPHRYTYLQAWHIVLVCLFICMYACMYACMYVCIHIWVALYDTTCTHALLFTYMTSRPRPSSCHHNATRSSYLCIHKYTHKLSLSRIYMTSRPRPSSCPHNPSRTS